MSDPNPFGCIEASGRTDRDGYVFHGQSRAHKVAWERVNGEVPDGMELEHMCRNRACCAVHHLEIVTREENERRKSWRFRAKRTTCPKGHDLKTNRVVTQFGGIVCRSCNREARDARE